MSADYPLETRFHGAGNFQHLENFAHMPLTLLTGPVRSGKSAFAQRLASESGRAVTYVATAHRDAGDTEWEARLARHAQDRPAGWSVLESATMSSAEQHAFFGHAGDEQCLIVDSLGTWIANTMDAGTDPAALESDALEFASILLSCKAKVIAVGEQVGWDVVPVASSARLFRDVLGRMQARLAAGAEEAFLLVAGYAIDLRAIGRPVS